MTTGTRPVCILPPPGGAIPAWRSLDAPWAADPGTQTLCGPGHTFLSQGTRSPGSQLGSVSSSMRGTRAGVRETVPQSNEQVLI